MSADGPSDCIFCKIVRQEAPAHLVHEDERCLVFMDIFPVADGHTLIIPKAHCDDVFGADPEDLREVVGLSQQVAHALREVVAPEGIAVIQLNGAAAGQTVFHYHMHLIPRNTGDPIGTLHGRKPGDPARLAELAGKLRDALAAGS